MTTLNPYIGFNGRCREAMTFYQECLGGELNLQCFKDSPLGDSSPAEMRNQILHSTLTNGSLLIMGSDMAGPGGFVKGNDMAISVNCGTEEEINNFYKKLGDDGKVLDPLKMQFWGGMFGVVEDRFGIRWMLHYSKNEQS